MTADVKRWIHCPACGEHHSRNFVTFSELAFVRCAACGLVYKQFENVALRPTNFYEKDYFHGRRSGRDRRFAHRVRKCMRQIGMAMGVKPIASVLDIGCSFGYVIEAAQRLGLSGAGVDISQYAVDVCRQRGYRAEQGSLEQLPFADRQFDLVVMKHVLEHTPDPGAALQQVRRVCAPDGLVMIMVPSLRYWKAWLMRKTCRYFRPDDLGMQHYFYCTPDTLHKLLERSGYEVITQSKAFVRPRFQSRPSEWLRFAGLWLWQRIAWWTFMQREAFAIARPRPSTY